MEEDLVFSKETSARFHDRGFWGKRTLGDLLEESARRYPEKEAVFDERKKITFHQLNTFSSRLALKFFELGIGKGDIVLVQLPHWLEIAFVYFSLFKIGAIGCPVNPSYRKVDLESLVRFTEAKAIIIPAQFKKFNYPEMIRALALEVSTLKHVFFVGEDSIEDMISLNQAIESDIETKYPHNFLNTLKPLPSDAAELIFTSGTTGNPKGVLHSHRALVASCIFLPQQIMRVNDRDTYFIASSMAHQFGLVQGLFTAVANGCRSVISEVFDGERSVRLMEQEKATIALGVPAQVISILAVPNLSEHDLSSLRIFQTAGSKCPPETIKQLRSTLKCNVVIDYGTSESNYMAMTRLDDPMEIVCETVGRPPFPSYEVKLLNERLREVRVGDVGEICCRTPEMFMGYFKNPKATKEVMIDEGFLLSGDLGIQDSGKNIKIVGRMKDLIIRGGENIYPIEIEELLLAHPKILNVAIVGYPDPRLGERSCACVIPGKGETITLEDLQLFLKDMIAIYKIPERLKVMEEFPLTLSSKIRKHILKDLVAQDILNE